VDPDQIEFSSVPARCYCAYLTATSAGCAVRGSAGAKTHHRHEARPQTESLPTSRQLQPSIERHDVTPTTTKIKPGGAVGCQRAYAEWQTGRRKKEPYGHQYGLTDLEVIAAKDLVDEVIVMAGGTLRHGSNAAGRAEMTPKQVERWRAAYARRGLAG
jgi:hypothetical protein